MKNRTYAQICRTKKQYVKNDLEVANIELKQKLQRMKMDRDALQVKLANIVQGLYFSVNLAYQSERKLNA